MAPIFALAGMALLLMIALAFEYSSALRARASLQSATDSLVLEEAMATGAQLTSSQLSTMQARLTSRLRSQTGDQTVSVTLKQSTSGELCVTANGVSKLAFGGLVGMSTLPVAVSSCAAPPSGGLEISLALDVSGSMAAADVTGSKIAALQVAAAALVDSVAPSGSSSTNQVAVAVAPFSTAVNVGTGFAGASWLDLNGNSSIHWQNYTRPPTGWRPTSRFELFSQIGVNWGGCVEERPSPYTTTDDPATTSVADTLFVPFLAPSEPVNWYNRYLDENGGYCSPGDIYTQADASDPVSAGSGFSKICKYRGQSAIPGAMTNISGYMGTTALFPAGPNFGCPATPVQTLTTDLSSAIKGSSGVLARLQPGGDTTLVSGFMWAWRLISPNGPFANLGASTGVGLRKPTAYGPVARKVIVLMTDGFSHWASVPDNARSTYSSLGYYVNNRVSSFGGGASTTADNYRSQMDAALLDGCARAKAAGVTVFTVGFSTSDSPIDAQGASVLGSCASSPAFSFMATDGNALKASFEEIAKATKKLRLTK